MKRPRKGKNPFEGELGGGAKQSSDTQPPIFSFEKMENRTGFSVNCCDKDERSALAKKLFQLSQTIWREIRNAPRHGIGTETIDRKVIKPALPATIPEDAAILALRYNGKKPMVGYRQDRIFYVLFLDHNFSVYPHG